jgi:hypothetical protein
MKNPGTFKADNVVQKNRDLTKIRDPPQVIGLDRDDDQDLIQTQRKENAGNRV